MTDQPRRHGYRATDDAEHRAAIDRVGTPLERRYMLTADECRLLAFQGAVAALGVKNSATALAEINGVVDGFLADRS